MTNTATVNTTTAYFDLPDYIRQIQSVDVASQMAQSVAFAVDVALSQAVRQLLKNLRTDYEAHGYESWSEMTRAFEDSAQAEAFMRGAGLDQLGPITTIQSLCFMRDDWHNLASELTHMCFDWRGVPRNYEISSFEDFLTREVKLTVKPMTEARIAKTVRRRAGDRDGEDIAAVVERRLLREQDKLKDISNTLMFQQGATVTLYNLALRHDNGEAPATEFHQLAPELRRSLLTAALRGAERAEEFASSSKHVTDAEFDDISFAVIDVERDIKRVMAKL